MDYDELHRRTRERGVNLIAYGIVRMLFPIVFHLYFRIQRIGREHIPRHGPVIVASNHRSFLDPFVIATMAPRPMYYIAKKELFSNRLVAWLLSALGAFPVDRGAGDGDTIDTAKAILARGGIVLIFPEGTRTRPGPLGIPRRGVGRLALESGVPVVPVAIHGTEAIRRGWRLRPHKVRIRAGRPLTFPRVADPSPALAGAVTGRIWPCVMLQWEWLGGMAPLRRAAIIGAGELGTSLAVSLGHAGLEVHLGCRTAEQAHALAADGENKRFLPGVVLPRDVHVARAADLDLGDRDLVCLAVPAGALPAVLAAHGGQISARAGVVVAARGLVAPLGTLPSVFAAQRSAARAVAVLSGPAGAVAMLAPGASVVIASRDRAFARQLTGALRAAGGDARRSADVIGVELAGCAAHAAALAAAVATTAGPGVAGTAAGRVFGEVDALARRCGARPETFAGLSGAGELVATVAAGESPERLAGELLAQGVAAAEIGHVLGTAAEAVESVPMLAAAARRSGVAAPALEQLAALVQGRIAPEQWAATVTPPARSGEERSIRAA